MADNIHPLPDMSSWQEKGDGQTQDGFKMEIDLSCFEARNDEDTLGEFIIVEKTSTNDELSRDTSPILNYNSLDELAQGGLQNVSRDSENIPQKASTDDNALDVFAREDGHCLENNSTGGRLLASDPEEISQEQWLFPDDKHLDGFIPEVPQTIVHDVDDLVPESEATDNSQDASTISDGNQLDDFIKGVLREVVRDLENSTDDFLPLTDRRIMPEVSQNSEEKSLQQLIREGLLKVERVLKCHSTDTCLPTSGCPVNPLKPSQRSEETNLQVRIRKRLQKVVQVLESNSADGSHPVPGYQNITPNTSTRIDKNSVCQVIAARLKKVPRVLKKDGRCPGPITPRIVKKPPPIKQQYSSRKFIREGLDRETRDLENSSKVDSSLASDAKTAVPLSPTNDENDLDEFIREVLQTVILDLKRVPNDDVGSLTTCSSIDSLDEQLATADEINLEVDLLQDIKRFEDNAMIDFLKWRLAQIARDVSDLFPDIITPEFGVHMVPQEQSMDSSEQIIDDDEQIWNDADEMLNNILTTEREPMDCSIRGCRQPPATTGRLSKIFNRLGLKKKNTTKTVRARIQKRDISWPVPGSLVIKGPEGELEDALLDMYVGDLLDYVVKSEKENLASVTGHASPVKTLNSSGLPPHAASSAAKETKGVTCVQPQGGPPRASSEKFRRFLSRLFGDRRRSKKSFVKGNTTSDRGRTAL